MSNQVELSEDTKALIINNPKVYSTLIKKSSAKEARDEEDAARGYVRKKNERPQVVSDYLAVLFKISNNVNFHVPVRVSKLNAWAAKFRTGFPAKNNQEFATRWSTMLAATAEALASQLIAIEKAKTGRSDVGQYDGPDQKKLKDATIQDLASTVPA